VHRGIEGLEKSFKMLFDITLITLWKFLETFFVSKKSLTGTGTSIELSSTHTYISKNYAEVVEHIKL